MSNAIDITDANFEEEVLKNSKPVVIDFWAPWCGPCRKLTPMLDEIAGEFETDVKFVKINTDENLETAQKYSVSGLPTILIFKDGEPKERLVGMMPKTTIISKIKNCL